MLKVLHSKVCHKKTKACAKALKKVCHKKTKKHSKKKHKHKKKHKKSDVLAEAGATATATATATAGAGVNPLAPQALGLPYTPNPAPSGFTSYHSPLATAVNRNDLLSLQKEFTNGLSEIRNLYKPEVSFAKPKNNPWAMNEPTATGKPPGTRPESALGGVKGSGSLRNDPDNTHFESGNLGPD